MPLFPHILMADLILYPKIFMSLQGIQGMSTIAALPVITSNLKINLLALAPSMQHIPLFSSPMSV